MTEEGKLEEIKEKAMAFYSEHGYLPIAFASPMEVGDEMAHAPAEFHHPESRFLADYRWKVLGKSSLAELARVQKLIGTKVATMDSLPIGVRFYRIVALD